MRHGAGCDPPNRFEAVSREIDPEALEADADAEFRDALANRRIEYLFDTSQSVVSENQSPDIPFRYSLNPYRGCAHACPYCYARNSHEYLGFNAGLDFETKIVVKREAPRLFREFLQRPGWRSEWITFSGITDCYQPAEREFQLTRQCLQIAWEHRQAVGIITKNALVVRDLDILQQMARENLVQVFLSITSLDAELARVMEPRTSTPAARLRAVAKLAECGVPVGVMTAPIIPGLNDSEIPELLAAAQAAGAQAANYILLRLPLTVEPVFREWLQRTHPQQQAKIESRLQQAREGRLNSSEWGERMRGTGVMADQIRDLFRLFAQKHGLYRSLPTLDTTRFHRFPQQPQQRTLFDNES